MMAGLSEEKILSLLLGELDQDQAALVQKAVDQSPEFSQRAARMRAILETIRTDDSEAPGAEAARAALRAVCPPESSGKRSNWWETLDRIIAAITFDSRTQPALAGYRGGTQGYQLSYEAPDVDIDVEVRARSEEDESAGGVILGNIAAAGGAGDVVLLESGSGAPVLHGRADQRGNFRIEAPQGEYEMGIRLAERVVMLSGIRIE